MMLLMNMGAGGSTSKVMRAEICGCYNGEFLLKLDWVENALSGRFRKAEATSNLDVIRHHWPKGHETSSVCLR